MSLEGRLDEERCLCAIGEIAEGELTPLPRVGHQEDLSGALHRNTKTFMQVIYVFPSKVMQALLTPEMTVSRGRFDLSHDGGEVFDPGIMTAACLVGFTICPNRLPVEKSNLVP